MTMRQGVLQRGLEAKRPTYVYDLAVVRRQCEKIETESGSIFFATMANDHPAILKTIRDRGHGVFVNSPRHLALSRELGFAPSKIVYAASNMTPEEMQLCVQHGIHVIVDSLGQLRAFIDIAGRGAEVGVRLCVGSALDGGEIRDDASYRFGLMPSEIAEALTIAHGAGVHLVGVHSYFGTDLMQPDVLLDGLSRLAAAAEQLPDLEYLDVGGGFGVSEGFDREFDLAAYRRGAAEIMLRLETKIGRRVRLVLEPGRFLVAACGYFFVRVVDVKPRRDRVFIGTNGSVAIFPRPLMYPEHAAHPCEIFGAARGAEPHDLPIYICGNSTYSRDFLARAVRMPLPTVGDTLVFHKAGAYCRSMITDFLGKDRPDELILDEA
jgi:diaminopimelate decarboxylase